MGANCCGGSPKSGLPKGQRVEPQIRLNKRLKHTGSEIDKELKLFDYKRFENNKEEYKTDAERWAKSSDFAFSMMYFNMIGFFNDPFIVV